MNTSSNLTLSASEMTSLFRMLLHLDPLPDPDIQITSTTGASQLLERRIRAWYLSLLTTLPLSQLPLVDIAPQLSLSLSSNPMTPASISLPDSVLRVHSVKLQSWQRHAIVIPPTHHAVASLDSPYAPARSAAPVAVERAPGILSLHSPHPSGVDSLSSCLAVIDPGPQSFILSPHIISLINNITPCTLLSSQH